MDSTDKIADATILERISLLQDRQPEALRQKKKKKKKRAYVHYSYVKLSISHLVRVIRYRAVLESNFHSNRNVRSQITA